MSTPAAKTHLSPPAVEHADVAGLAAVNLSRTSDGSHWHSHWWHSSSPSTGDPTPSGPATTTPAPDATSTDASSADTTPADTTPTDTTPTDTGGAPAADPAPSDTGSASGDSSWPPSSGSDEAGSTDPAAADTTTTDTTTTDTTQAAPPAPSSPAAGFWSATSFLNTPLSSFSVDPNSANWLGQLEGSEPYGLWVDDTSWSPPIYHASSSTPTVTVSIENTGAHITVPYQSSFTPDPSGDSQLAVIDDSTGCEYEFQAFDPGSLSAHAEATFAIGSDTGAQAIGGGVTGASISELGGLITPEDVASGSIDHALRVATPINSSSFVAPATSSDGGTPGGIPEGQLVRLDPSLDLSQFGLDPFQLMVATALQRYGGYVADNSGSFKVYAESTVDGSSYAATPGALPWSVASRLQFGSTSFGADQLPVPAARTGAGCNQER